MLFQLECEACLVSSGALVFLMVPLVGNATAMLRVCVMVMVMMMNTKNLLEVGVGGIMNK